LFAAQNKSEELDTILLETLTFLSKNWLDPNTGIVACCLVDGDKKAFATSSKNPPFWIHAERNAYTTFKHQYQSEPSSSAFFVVTLSPCLIDLKHRQEASCTDLLNQLGIKRIHFGVLDAMHAKSLDAYRQAGLLPSLSKDSTCKILCEKLMGLFATYDARINTDLMGIKKELGEDFFAKLNQIPVEVKRLAY
jgi:pyrimidine deaminase RibD-like protein